MTTTQATDAEPTAPAHRFADAFLDRDHAAVERTLADDVRLRSPIISTPFEGKREVMHVLEVVRECFDELEMVDELGDDRTIMFSFNARIGRQQMRGVDILRLDGEGRIREFTIQVRPLAGVTELAAAIAGGLARSRGVLWMVLAIVLVLPLRVIGRVTDRLGGPLAVGRYRPTW